MLSTPDLFVHCCPLIDDLISSGQVAISRRPGPGPGPGCSDAEVMAIVLVRHLLHLRGESGFLAERLPHNSEFNLRARWLRGAFEQARVARTPGPARTA